MVRRTAVGRAGTVDPDALVLFLDELRSAGYGIGTEQYIAVHDLVLALAAVNGGVVASDRLRGMLGPLVCGTPRQQAEFGPLFDRWLDRLIPFPGQSPAAATTPADAATAIGRPALSEQLDAMRRTRRWLRSVATPVAVVLAIAFVGVYVALRRNTATLDIHTTPDHAVVHEISRDSARTAGDSTPRDARDSLGLTPLQIASRPGEHVFAITSPGHRDTSVTVKVEPRASLDIDIKLVPLDTGTLWFRTAPGGATVVIDTTIAGRTPPSATGGLSIRVVEGPHRVRMLQPGYRPIERTVTVRPRTTDSTAVTFEPARQVRLAVTSTPPGAAARLDGRALPRTPLALADVDEGSHELRLTLDGFAESVTTFTATRDTTIDVALSTLVPVTARSASFRRIAFADDGRIAAGDYDRGVVTWNPTTRQLVDSPPPIDALGRFRQADTVSSADGSLTATRDGRRAILRTIIRDALGGESAATAADTLDDQRGRITAMALSPDGRFLASGDSTGEIRIWATSPQPEHTLDPRVPGWTKRLASPFQGSSRRADDSLVVMTGGDLVLATSAATGAAIWEISSGARRDLPVRPDTTGLGSMILDGAGTRVIRFGSGGADVWELDGSPARRALTGEPVVLATSRRDGRQVALLMQSGDVQVWDVGDRLQPAALRDTHRDPDLAATGSGVELSDDGRLLLTRSASGLVKLWPSGASQPLQMTGDTIVGARLIDASRIITLSHTGMLRTWHTDPAGAAVLDSSVFVPDATASTRIRIMLMRRWRLVRTARFSPDGRYVAVTFLDSRQVTVLSTDAGRQVRSLDHDARVEDVSFSGDGTHIVTAAGGRMYVWNTSGVTELADLEMHRAEIRGLAFSPSGDRLAAVSADGLLTLWDTRTFALADSLTSSGTVAATPDDIAFSRDGRALATVSDSGVVRLYDTPTSRWRTIGRSALRAWPLGVALLLLPLPWLVYRWLVLRRATAFVRRQTGGSPVLERIRLRSAGTDLFPAPAVLRVATRLRQRVEVPSTDLDVERTVARTLYEGGVFTPAFRLLKVKPEYLALVDRTTLGDQQAAFVDELLDRLERDQVLITRYYFDGDPRVCFPADPRAVPLSLGALTQQYESHRVLLFVDARRCFNAVTGEVAAWMDLLRRWPQRALLTPEPPASWGTSEAIVSREFPVQHAGIGGLATLLEATPARTVTGPGADTSPAPYPVMLRRRPGRWIQRDQPPEEEVAAMLSQLRAYLDDASMAWLAACAVYPALSWPLTVNLGHEVRMDDGSRLLDPDRLLRLARLPWFRHGYIPDWLRLRLLETLPPAQEAQIRGTLETLLLTSVAGNGSAFDLEIASRHARTVHTLAGPILRRLRRQAAPSDPLRDYVFAEFMNGRRRERLAVRVARAVPALRGRRATSPAGVGTAPASTERSWSWAPVALVALYVVTKILPPAANAMESAWNRIPAAPSRMAMSSSAALDDSLAARTDTTLTRTTGLARRRVSSVPAESTLGPEPDDSRFVGTADASRFDDPCWNPAEVHVRAGWWVDAVQLVCRDDRDRRVPGTWRGGSGGADSVFTLQSGERITALSGSYDGQYGAFLYSLQVHTDRRSSPVYGNGGPSKGQTSFRFTVPAGFRFAGLVGRAGEATSSDGNVGSFVLSLGVHIARDSAERDPVDVGTINTAVRALCADADRILAGFPFTRDTARTATLADVESFLRPNTGSLWRFLTQTLGGLVVQDAVNSDQPNRGVVPDTQWIARPNANATVTPEFLLFLNRAARASEFLFPQDSALSVDLNLRADLSPRTTAVTFTLGDEVLRLTPAAPSRSVTWRAPSVASRFPGDAARARPGSQGSARVGVETAGTERLVAEATGDWALFALLARATRISALDSRTLRFEWTAAGAPDARASVSITFRTPFPLLAPATAAQCPDRAAIR